MSAELETTEENDFIKNPNFVDGRNRKWTVFNDINFFNYFCIKCEDGSFFYQTNHKAAKQFCDLIKMSY